MNKLLFFNIVWLLIRYKVYGIQLFDEDASKFIKDLTKLDMVSITYFVCTNNSNECTFYFKYNKTNNKSQTNGICATYIIFNKLYLLN